jgi:MerR family transcriptional regulator, heat shock protein HspR
MARTPAPSCCGGRRDEQLQHLPHHRVENAAVGGGNVSAVRRERVDVSVDSERGVFMISVAAELAHMHPQTLRMYEARGLIEPQRSPKNTRLYSQRDVERLRHIQSLTSEQGLNLAGVETVLRMEDQVEKMKAKLERLRRHAAELERRISMGGF